MMVARRLSRARKSQVADRCASATILFKAFAMCLASAVTKNPTVAAAAETDQQLIDRNDDSFYIKYSRMRCAQSQISSVTSCYVSDEFNQTPYCFLQSLNVIDKEKYQSNIVIYNHPMRGGSPNFVYSMSCVNYANEKYLILRGTNFSLCEDCEWIDVFKADGVFLGTSSTDNKDLSQPFRRLDPQLGRSLTKRDARVTDKAEINRQSDDPSGEK